MSLRNVWTSVWRSCLWILWLKGLISLAKGWNMVGGEGGEGGLVQIPGGTMF